MQHAIKLRKVLDAMHKLGFGDVRQKGSHLFMEHPDGRTTVIPLHKEIKVGLLVKIIKKDLRMEVDVFFGLL